MLGWTFRLSPSGITSALVALGTVRVRRRLPSPAVAGELQMSDKRIAHLSDEMKGSVRGVQRTDISALSANANRAPGTLAATTVSRSRWGLARRACRGPAARGAHFTDHLSSGASKTSTR